MTVVDSCGWIEVLIDGSLADRFEAYLDRTEEVLTPTVVIYEVHKILMRETSAPIANQAVAAMGETEVVVLDDRLALEAADLSLQYGLPMADAIVYATAQAYEALLVTSDAHFTDLPGVEYLEEDDNGK